MLNAILFVKKTLSFWLKKVNFAHLLYWSLEENRLSVSQSLLFLLYVERSCLNVVVDIYG